MAVYYIVAISVAVVAYFKPLYSMLSYLFAAVVLSLGLVLYINTPEKSYYGDILNISILSLMCGFINIYIGSHERRNFIYRQLIIEKNAKLQYFADNDALTGLRSRRFLDDDMDALFKECSENKLPLTVMMIDIDSFKSYNDTYGHIYGDECLSKVASRIQQELNVNEYLIRYGGEEFLYVGKNVDLESAIAKARLYNDVIRNLNINFSQNKSTNVTISVGVYTENFENDGCRDWHSCIDYADKALYNAKENGKDRCCFANL